MTSDPDKFPGKSSSAQIGHFLRAAANPATGARSATRGRLIFALDATASRQPAWDQARRIQAQMFQETTALGGLDLQLCYFRGQREFVAGAWLSDAAQLAKSMSGVTSIAGRTQMELVLRHTAREAASARVNALVFVGDAMEEKTDRIFAAANELGSLGVPAFLFQEGGNPAVKRAFCEIVKLTGGAWHAFDAASARQLRDLLSAVAVYAAGGQPALEAFGERARGAARQLAHQLCLSHDRKK